MKDTLLRRALLLFVAFGISACDGDDPSDLDELGTSSDVAVRAYQEVNGNDTFDAGVDQPLASTTITLESTLTDNVLTAETDAEGLATFDDVPAGVYNAVIDTLDLPDGLTDVAIAEPGLEQTVVAPFEGSDTPIDASFAFRFMPATIGGTVFQDVDRSGTFDAAIDTLPTAGVTVYLYPGATATGEPTDTVESDVDGTFEFTVYPGTYTLEAQGDALTDVVTEMPVTLVAEATDEIDLTVLVASAVLTIADAEALDDGTVVLIDGVVTVEPGNISGSYYWIQDATGGIKINDADADFVLGDSLRISGEIITDFGEREINAVTIEELGTGDVPEPILLDGDEFLSGVHQGELVTVDSLLVDSVGTGGSYNVFVTDVTADTSFIIRVDSDTDIGPGVFTAGQRYTVTGVSSPFGGMEQLYVRDFGDIIPLDADVLPIASARSVEDSTVVTVTGVVHTATGNISGSYFFMHDRTGGMKVFLAGGTAGSAWAQGDTIEVTGEKVTRFGEVQIEATAITDLGTGTVRDPIVVDGDEFLTGQTQGNLVTVPTVTVEAVGGTTGSYNVDVVDPETGAEFIIRVDSDAGIPAGTFVVGNSYTVTGVSSPFSGAEQVYVRSVADIVAH